MPGYDDRVFINVPFDPRYKKLFDALVFAVHDCGFLARCALESDDGSRVRLDKRYAIIAECRYGIHDLSRVTLDTRYRLPRFNMPLELGIFLGAKRYGNPTQRKKSGLILERDPYRYQIYCSDIAGQDIRAHENRADWDLGSPKLATHRTRPGRCDPQLETHGGTLHHISMRLTGHVPRTEPGFTRPHFFRLPYPRDWLARRE